MTLLVKRAGTFSKSVSNMLQLVVLAVGQVSALTVANAIVELRFGSALWAVNPTRPGLDPWLFGTCALCGAAASFATAVLLNRLLARGDGRELRRSATTLSFVIFCMLLGGMAFGAGAPIPRSDNTSRGVISIATSAADDVRIDAYFGEPGGTHSAALLSGGLSLFLTVQAPPGTIVDIAVGYFGAEKPTMEPSKDRGGRWSVGPFDSTASSAICGLVWPDDQERDGYVATTSTEVGKEGAATAWIDVNGPFNWISTSGDQNLIEPPVINGAWETAAACAKAGQYRPPKHQVIKAAVNPSYSVSFRDQISPAQPFTTTNSGPDRLRWTAETTSGQVGQFFPQVNPAYAISTADTQRWGSGALYLSALLAGGALTGAFELLRDWPRRIQSNPSSARHRKDN
jgi:hypothetical protein